MNTSRKAGIVFLVGTLALLGTAAARERGDGMLDHADELEAAFAPQASPTTSYSRGLVCSAVVSGNWRDTINVGDSWNSSMCRSWAVSVGAKQYQMGTITDTGFSWGPAYATGL